MSSPPGGGAKTSAQLIVAFGWADASECSDVFLRAKRTTAHTRTLATARISSRYHAISRRGVERLAERLRRRSTAERGAIEPGAVGVGPHEAHRETLAAGRAERARERDRVAARE